MGADTLPRAVEAVERLVSRVSTPDELFEVVATELDKSVPHDGGMWFGVDPATLLAVAPARMERVADGYCELFWHLEFHEQDTNLFSDLARAPEPAAALRLATGNQPNRSMRFRDFLQPQGYDDELRTVFRTGHRTWGAAAILREAGRAPFDESDVAVVNAISDTVARALRTNAALSDRPSLCCETPGLMLFDRSGGLLSANDAAACWLADIYGQPESTNWFEVLAGLDSPDVDAAVPIYPLIARAHAVAAGRDAREARLRLRDRSGRWLVLHASVLQGAQREGHVAIVVEPAKSADLAPIIIEAYGLTQRERDVVRALARGTSTPDIAAELFLSAHTVRDYIKAVFEKVGVSSRGELVAKLFAEHYADPFHESVIHVD